MEFKNEVVFVEKIFDICAVCDVSAFFMNFLKTPCILTPL